MEEHGYLYILANSAMPGLVKVGKTTRSPSERAGELSGATGLPTPFIVVYEQLFEDCDAAESFVHAFLAQQGYRVSDNREFFSAPVNIVVRAIALASGAIDHDSLLPAAEQADDLLERGEPDELDSLSLSQSEAAYPWSSILDEAEGHYYGYGDYIQDYAEALQLFRQAVRLGALPAYRYIGEMYERGEGVREDRAKALEFYKEGARKGSPYCYWAMGSLFLQEDAQQNAEKCYQLFLRHMPTLPDGRCLTNLELDGIIMRCYIFLTRKIVDGIEPPGVLSGFIADKAQDILVKAKYILANYCNNIGEVTRCRKAIEHLQSK